MQYKPHFRERKNKRLQVLCWPSLHELLIEEAKKRDIGVSGLVTDILAAYFNQPEQRGA